MSNKLLGFTSSIINADAVNELYIFEFRCIQSPTTNMVNIAEARITAGESPVIKAKNHNAEIDIIIKTVRPDFRFFKKPNKSVITQKIMATCCPETDRT